MAETSTGVRAKTREWNVGDGGSALKGLDGRC